MQFPSDREGSLARLQEFLPFVPRYAWQRNAVVPGHGAVSRLSPAIRHRLLTEDETAAAVLAAHPFGKIEKFVQEVYWRRYWKAWLSLRPEVWVDYRERSRRLIDADGGSTLERAAAGNLGNAVMDYFARELVETGYLHNHARMWFAAWWIHQARLPWELGAAFFLSHLLDGDPASNTLSWRWVAGLQTPGKTYLARRLNLEKYLAKELLVELSDGLAAFENPVAKIPEGLGKVAVSRAVLDIESFDEELATGLWIHEENLSPERGELGGRGFEKILVTGHAAGWRHYGYPERKTRWLENALADAGARARGHWKCNVETETTQDLADSLVRWARDNGIRQIATLRPEVGPLDDALASVTTALDAAEIRLVRVDLRRDLELRPLANSGFFKFWETMVKRGLVPGSL